MYPDLDEARIHATRATGIHRADISIVSEHGGFTLHVDPDPTLTVVEVVAYAPEPAPTT